MSEAPERIFATGNDTTGSWNAERATFKGPLEAEYVRADRIEELESKLSLRTNLHEECIYLFKSTEAKLAKAVEALTVIDALDPEGLINGCSQPALIGLVLRMGEIARTTLAELTGGLKNGNE